MYYENEGYFVSYIARLPQLLVNINKQPMVDVLLHDNANLLKNMHACLATVQLKVIHQEVMLCSSLLTYAYTNIKEYIL